MSKHIIGMPDDVRMELVFQLLKESFNIPNNSILSDAKKRDLYDMVMTVTNSKGAESSYPYKCFSPNAGALMKHLKANNMELYNALTPFFYTSFGGDN